MAAPSSSSVPALRTQERKETALHGALQVLAPGAATERPDTPDGVVTAVRRLPATPAAHVPFPEGLDERLRAALVARGATELYSHQGEAFAHVAAGRHIVVTTPTASGKTLCYNLPVLDAVLKKPATRALYLFPTKALAQDQMAELHDLAERISASGGGGHRRSYLRRRHAPGRPPHDPHPRSRGAQQSRHAALGDSAAPSEVGEAVREPPFHRH